MKELGLAGEILGRRCVTWKLDMLICRSPRLIHIMLQYISIPTYLFWKARIFKHISQDPCVWSRHMNWMSIIAIASLIDVIIRERQNTSFSRSSINITWQKAPLCSTDSLAVTDGSEFLWEDISSIGNVMVFNVFGCLSSTSPNLVRCIGKRFSAVSVFREVERD
jgi:hypothetical protein